MKTKNTQQVYIHEVTKIKKRQVRINQYRWQLFVRATTGRSEWIVAKKLPEATWRCDQWCAWHEHKGAGENPAIVRKGGNMK